MTKGEEKDDWMLDAAVCFDSESTIMKAAATTLVSEYL